MAYRNQTKYEFQHQVPEEYHFPEWLTDVKPRKTPYFPQLEDELVFFVQGYLLYLKAVAKNKIYQCDVNEALWKKRNSELNGIEYVKIIKLNYEFKPPRPHLCCLVLNILDSNLGRLTDKYFSIKYHDISDIDQFLILKQTYEQSIKNKWIPGKRFWSYIDYHWWHGTVECQEPLDPNFPNSLYKCYQVFWDTGETERISPWNMESTNENDKWPCAVCRKSVGYNSIFCRFCKLWVHKRCSGIKDKLSSVSNFKCKICKDEKNETLKLTAGNPEGVNEFGYQLNPDEWFNKDPNLACQHIADMLNRTIERLAIAKPFLVPVDISMHSSLIDYPIDLNTIKRRLENNFYRTIYQILFDIFYIAKNAEKFYKEGSVNVIQARLVTYLCSTLIMDGVMADLAQLYSELQDKCLYLDHRNEDESKLATELFKKRGRKKKIGRKEKIADDQPEQQQINEDWNILCRRIGDDIHKYQDVFLSTFADLIGVNKRSNHECQQGNKQVIFSASQTSNVALYQNVTTQQLQEEYHQQHLKQKQKSTDVDIVNESDIEICNYQQMKHNPSVTTMQCEEDKVDMGWNIKMEEIDHIDEKSELNPLLQISPKFLEMQSNIYTLRKEKECLTSHQNYSTRKEKVNTTDFIHYHQIEDFVAEASAFDNVLISYKPLNECIMCYEKFDSSDISVLYHPLRTKIKCKSCNLVIYTIINEPFKKKKV